jgi:hypothetical protein
LSFPEREGGPLRISAMVDRFLHRPYDSLLPFCWIGSNTVSKFTLGVLTPYPQAGPFPLSGGHNAFPLFHRTGRLLLVVSVAGDTNLCPSLKGKGDQPYGWWMGSYTDPASNTVCCRLSGVLTPYPLKRVLSPFQGDTMLFPFSAGLGDSSSSSPSRGTQIFVLP